MIGIAIISFGWELTWKVLHIPTLSPVFADMRTIQGALLSVEQGYNPQQANPGDPWQRAMNYPSLWLVIARHLQFDNEVHFLIFVFSTIVAYLTACIFLLKTFPRFLMIAALFSGASLLAVERGNNDIIVFALLSVGLTLPAVLVRSGVLLISTVLKLYPMFAFLSLIKHPRQLLVGMTIAVVYFIGIQPELQFIWRGNTAEGVLSYGIANLFRWITAQVGNELEPIAVGLGLIASLPVCLLFTRNTHIQPSPQREQKTTLFLAGGAIFAGTYLTTLNWDYRLIFLIFCLPYILDIQQPLPRYSLVTCLLIASNIGILRWHLPVGLVEIISILCKHYVFLAIIGCLGKEFYLHMRATRTPALHRLPHNAGEG